MYVHIYDSLDQNKTFEVVKFAQRKQFMDTIYFDHVISICIFCDYPFHSTNLICVCPRIDDRAVCTKIYNLSINNVFLLPYDNVFA